MSTRPPAASITAVVHGSRYLEHPTYLASIRVKTYPSPAQVIHLFLDVAILAGLTVHRS
jgi:hypothetical protein